MSDGIRVSTNNFKYAEWYLRLASLVIDMLIVNFLVLLLVPGAFKISDLLMGGHYSALFSFLVSFDGMWFWLAPMIYTILFWGQFSRTPGMMIVKTKVINIDGKKIGWLMAVLRTFAYILASIPLFLGFLPILFDRKKQGLHDRLTRTFVVLKR